jgi:hypothetical protein
MGWFQDLVSNPVGTLVGTAKDVVSNPLGSVNQLWNTGGRDAATLAALGYGGYQLGMNALAGGASGAAGAAANAGAAGATGAAAGATGAAAGAAGAGLLSGSSWMTPAAILGSSLLGGYSSGKAADVQAAAADRAAALQAYQFERQTELQAPFREAGLRALGKLEGASEYTPFGMGQFQQDPGYAFRLGEGQKALDRQAAARGGLISGGALKAAQRYGQEMGSQEYQNAFNRYQTERQAKLGPLQSLAGVGQTSAQAIGQAGQQYATSAGEAIGAGAQARASGYMGQAGALGGGLNQYLNYQNQQSQNALLQQALGRNQPTYGYSGD